MQSQVNTGVLGPAENNNKKSVAIFSISSHPVLIQLNMGKIFVRKILLPFQPAWSLAVFFPSLFMKTADLLLRFISLCEQTLPKRSCAAALFVLSLVFFLSSSQLIPSSVLCFSLYTWVGITSVWLTELMGMAVKGTLITDSDVNTPILPFHVSYIPLPFWHSVPLILLFVFDMHFLSWLWFI